MFKGGLIVTLTSFLQKGVGFLLVPIYTVYLTPDDFGEIALVSSLAAGLILLFSLALDDAVTKSISTDIEDSIVSVSTIFTAVFLLSCFFIVIILILGNLIPDTLLEHQDLLKLKLGLAAVVAAPLFTLMQKVYLGRNQHIKYAINTFSFFCVNSALIILFVIYLRQGVLGYLKANAICYSIFYIRSIFFWANNFHFNVVFSRLIDALEYSKGLILNRILTWGNDGLRNILVGTIMSVSTLGLFSVGNYLVMIITTISQSIGSVYHPFLLKQVKKHGINSSIVKDMVSTLTIVFSLMTFILGLFSKEISILIFDSKFEEITDHLMLLIWSAGISSISMLFNYTLYIDKGTTRYVSRATLLRVLSGLCSLLLLAEIYQLWAVTYSMIFSSVVAIILTVYYSVKKVGLECGILTTLQIPFVLFLISLSIVAQTVIIKVFFSIGIMVLLIIKYHAKTLRLITLNL